MSAEVLRAVAPKSQVQVCGDSVLWMKPAEQAPAEVQSLGRMVAVSLAPRWSREEAFGLWLAEHLARLARRLEATVVFVPFSTRFDDDRAEHRKVAGLMRQRDAEVRTLCLEADLGPRQVAAVLGRAVLTVGMRLHACVMAYGQRRPFVGLAYHPKIAAFGQTAGCRQFVLPAAVPPRQTAGAYGYSLAATGLLQADLASAGLEAVEKSRFEKLDDLRGRLAEAFVDTVGGR
jgi:polysaccharide pyruvyl transferase WcaK-like protein